MKLSPTRLAAFLAVSASPACSPTGADFFNAQQPFVEATRQHIRDAVSRASSETFVDCRHPLDAVAGLDGNTGNVEFANACDIVGGCKWGRFEFDSTLQKFWRVTTPDTPDYWGHAKETAHKYQALFESMRRVKYLVVLAERGSRRHFGAIGWTWLRAASVDLAKSEVVCIVESEAMDSCESVYPEKMRGVCPPS